MKTTIKKYLCVLNTILSAAAYLLLHATYWLARSSADGIWVYLDDSLLVFIPALLAALLAFCSVMLNPKESKKLYIAAAVVSAVPAIILTSLLSYQGRLKIDELLRLWRLIPAVILYFAVTALYFALAFTKTKEEEKQPETIPYSE